jgi:hypothetical protein
MQQMRALWPTRAALVAILATLMSVTAASASTVSFPLPSVPVPAPGCEFLADFTCAVAASGPTSFGSFTIDETGDMNNPSSLDLGVPLNRTCYPLTGTAKLDLGGGDSLGLTSSAATDTICISQSVDPQGAGVPPLGPWPLSLTLAVDPNASTGIYAGATGTATVNGTWLPTSSCGTPDAPIHGCGFSGEELAFTLTDVSIDNLTLVGGGPCLTDCGGGGGPGPGATPELDSLTLMGSGLAGLAAYLTVRMRARRRP